MIKTLFFSPNGRIARPQYWLGFAALCVFVVSGNAALRTVGFQTMPGFYLGMIFYSLALYMFYNLFAKRLHDMGRSVRPFFALIAAEVAAMIVIMLMFGGSEYFAEFSQYSREAEIDPEIANEITARYQANIAESMPFIRQLLMLLPALFVLWLGLSKSQPGDNAYGPPPD